MASSELSLQNICRLCGKEGAVQVGRTPHNKDTYTNIIQRALNIDITCDNSCVHPPFICHSCERKLKIWWDKEKRHKKDNICNINVPQFVEVGCPHCSSSVSSFEDIATCHNLVVWQGPTFIQAMRMWTNGLPCALVRKLADMSWELFVCNIQVVSGSAAIEGLPTRLEDNASIVALIHAVANTNVCVGVNEFPVLVKSKFGMKGEIPITITGSDVYQVQPFETVRHRNCSLLIKKPATRCTICKVHRGDLASAENRMTKNVPVTGSSSCTRNDLMSRGDLIRKTTLLSQEKRCLQRKTKSMAAQITNLIEREGTELQPEQQQQLEVCVAEHDDTLKELLGHGTPASLLWEQQKKSASKGKGMRWHPAVIRWCIAVRSKSASAYNLIRDSGFLHLPHPSTLHPYAHFGNPQSGFNADMMKRIMSDIKITSLAEHQRNITLAFDEMKVKSDLVYNMRSGRIVGFLDVGDIANAINSFERKCKGDEDPPLASHVLVLMIRGIFTSLRAPIAYYATCGVSSYQLLTIMNEAILLLETAGFKVRAIVSDGASANRKFYRLFGETEQTGTSYKGPNPANSSRDVYLFCDVPHLLKTTRNNWENSGWNNKTRNLHFRKQDIKWGHLVQLYENDVGLQRASPGLRKLHKLTYEHLHLTPSLRMRVYMAAQVLSSTVANALEAQGRHDTKSTQLFVSHFDKFFDCLNVSNPHDGRNKCKPALQTYSTPDDWRFKWLQENFLGFLDEWQKEADSYQDVDKETRRKMCLSRETLEGLRITISSFVELGKTLLTEPGVEYLLSEKFSQDPLEEYFSKQRSTGGSCDNPTVEQFGHNMFALHVASSFVKASKRGNVRKVPQGENSIDDTPLPKRPKCKY